VAVENSTVLATVSTDSLSTNPLPHIVALERHLEIMIVLNLFAMNLMTMTIRIHDFGSWD
jgi:hypothetical protein